RQPQRFYLLTRPPPTSPLFPYTTLFRSQHHHQRERQPATGPAQRDQGARGCAEPHAGRASPALTRLPRPAPEPTIASTIRRSSRSEEHTSELQSRFDLVCRLLLEKKKKQ